MVSGQEDFRDAAKAFWGEDRRWVCSILARNGKSQAVFTWPWRNKFTIWYDIVIIVIFIVWFFIWRDVIRLLLTCNANWIIHFSISLSEFFFHVLSAVYVLKHILFLSFTFLSLSSLCLFFDAISASFFFLSSSFFFFLQLQLLHILLLHSLPLKCQGFLLHLAFILFLFCKTLCSFSCL